MTPAIKPLAPEIKSHGFTLRLIKRTENVAMYAKSGGFEVIRVRRHPGGEMFGKKLEPYELYPSANLFGMYGWDYSGPNARERAEAKYASLVSREQEKEQSAHQVVADTDEVSESIAELVGE
jgi:hypothetical protein